MDFDSEVEVSDPGSVEDPDTSLVVTRTSTFSSVSNVS